MPAQIVPNFSRTQQDFSNFVAVLLCNARVIAIIKELIASIAIANDAAEARALIKIF
jgi:hypothetical protein